MSEVEQSHLEHLLELQHAHRLFYTDLRMCGCGSPGDSFTVIFRVLVATPRSGGVDAFNTGRYDWLTQGVSNGAGVSDLLLTLLSRAGLMEHGSAIGGSWLTPKGEYFRATLGGLTWDAVDTTGPPHENGECTDACWELSEAQRRTAPGPILPRREVSDTWPGRLSQEAVEGAMRQMWENAAPQPFIEPGFMSTVNPPSGVPFIEVPDTVAELWPAPEEERPEADRLPRGRNPFIGCRELHGTWIHGRPHDCPRTARGF